MLPYIFVFALLTFVCLGALYRPPIGVIGYYGFFLLMPEWNWRWALPPFFPYQKYVAAATLIGVLLSGLRGNRWTHSASMATACLLSFLGLAFLSAQFTIMPEETAKYMDALWKIVLMAVIAIHVLDSPRWIFAGLWSVALAQGYNAYQINDSYFERGRCIFVKRPWGYHGDANLYCIITIPIMAISAALMFSTRPLWQKVAAGAIFVLQMHQIMMMESRGCMIGSLVMVPLLLLLMPQTRWNWAAVTAAIVCGAILAGPSVVAEFSSSFRKEGERDSSAESRFLLWKTGARITADYPLLGVGPHAGQKLVAQYLGMPGGRKGLHNLFFEISTGCGVPATVLYCIFFGVAWGTATWALLRRRWQPLPDWAETTYVAVSTGLIGYMVASMFSSGAVLESSYLLGAFGLATSLILARDRRRERLQFNQNDLHSSGLAMNPDVGLEQP
jgi:O-antigen ligase